MLTKTRDSKDESPIDFKIFSRMVERAQKQIEGNNFDRRKTVLQYDEVLRKQREVIYQQRRDILHLGSIEDIVLGMIDRTVSHLVNTHIDPESKDQRVDAETLYKALDGRYFQKDMLDKNKLGGQMEEVVAYLREQVSLDLEDKKSHSDEERYNEFLKVVVLRVVDTFWVEHIDRMSELRQGIGLQSYAQMNPLREYQEVGYQMFHDMVQSIEDSVTRYVLRAVMRDNLQREQVAKPVTMSSGKDEPSKKKPRTVNKVGRNDPCPCGSGKKYKHCHGR
jgi:preprotein translocase subunit SecA